MCIGIPMQVLAVRDGFARAHGRGDTQELSTALIGPVQPGDWVLAFLGSAREAISAERAAEVNAVLDLVAGAMSGELAGAAARPGDGGAGFSLPSAMSLADLARLSGTAPLVDDASQPLT